MIKVVGKGVRQMADQNSISTKESEPRSEGVSKYHQKKRAEFHQRNLTGKLLIKSTEREWQISKQSKSKFYLYPHYFTDNALQEWFVFMQEIETRSGKHRHQGGIAIFILEGHGYTVVDGKRQDWKKGDLILFPVQPNGVEHQHFNEAPGGSRWMAFIFMPFYDQIASYTQQIEFHPQYKDQ